MTTVSGKPADLIASVNAFSHRRQQAGARRARERVRNARFVFACVAGLAALLGLGLYQGWLPRPLFGSHSLEGREDSFRKTRIGQVVFSSLDGRSCRQLLFDNNTGRLSAPQSVPCPGGLRPGAGQMVHGDATGGVNSVRQAFGGP